MLCALATTHLRWFMRGSGLAMGSLVAFASACKSDTSGDGALDGSVYDQSTDVDLKVDAADAGLATDSGDEAGEAKCMQYPSDTTCGADLQSDANHCGFCGRSCLGKKCVNGFCEATFLAPAHWLSLGIDEAHIYWTPSDQNTWGLWRVPKAGGPHEKVVDEWIGDFVLHGPYVYWTVTKASCCGLKRMLRSGGPV